MFSLASSLALFSLIKAGIGLRPSAWLWSSLTVLKLLPLLALILALVYQSDPRLSEPLPRSSGIEPAAWGRAVLLIVFSMQGFEIVPVPGSHVRSPSRNIPLATLASLVLCAGLYLVLHWCCVRVVPGLAASRTPLLAAAQALGGRGLATLVSVGTNISALGIGFGMMAMTPRYLAALSSVSPRSAKAVPGALAREGPSQVPRRALFVTLLLVVTLLGWKELNKLFVLSSVAVLFQYSVSVVALGCLALQKQRGLRLRDAVAAPVSLVTLALVACAVEYAELQILAAILLVSVLLWFARLRLRS